MSYTVGDLAKLAHVSVRALHHYDEIGLLQPSERNRAGYRLYSDRDLERLQQVLLFRELGFALDGIARILDDPAFDRRSALIAHRALLVEQKDRLQTMVELVDRTLQSIEKGAVMSHQDMFEAFGDYDPVEHEEEAEKRWGTSEAYAESGRRTKRYTKDDWKRMRAESDAITQAFSEALGDGASPRDARSRELAEKARLHIDRWFYPCSRAMHAALGQMYVTDPRFAANYDKVHAGLAQFVCDAIAANAAKG